MTMIVYTGKAPNGATVMIDDSMCARKGSDEERRIIEDQRQAAYNILRGMYLNEKEA